MDDREVGRGSNPVPAYSAAPVLRRGLMKELTEGIFSAGQAAFDALVEEFAQSARTEVFGALASKCTRNVWAKVASGPSSVSAAAWENLYTLISKGVEVKAVDDNSDQLWIDALEALHNNDRRDEPSPVRVAEGSALLGLFKTFTEFLLSRCGIKGFKERPPAAYPAHPSAMSAAAFLNEPAIIHHLDSQGADLLESTGACVESPAYVAFSERSVEAFTALLDSGKVKASSRFSLASDGKCCEGNFRQPLLVHLMAPLRDGRYPPELLRMVTMALRKDPGAKDIVLLFRDKGHNLFATNLLDICITSHSVEVVRSAFEVGGVVSTGGEPTTIDGIEDVVSMSTLEGALQAGSPEILKMLVEDHGLLSVDYSPKARKLIEGTVEACIVDYFQQPDSEGEIAKVEALLEAGYNCIANVRVLEMLSWPFLSNTPCSAAAFERVLTLFLSHGYCFKDLSKPGERTVPLIFAAAWSRSSRAVDLAIEAGEDVNEVLHFQGKQIVPLLPCITHKWTAGVRRLIEKGALAAVDGIPSWEQQPLSAAIASPFETDDESLLLIRRFQGRQPNMLSPRYYNQDKDGACYGPLFVAISADKYRCLEWLLNESGVDKASLSEAVDHFASLRAAENSFARYSAAQFACEAQDWKALDLLVRLGGASVTITSPDSPMPPVYLNPNLQRCPDRRLKALIESRAQKELELQKIKADKAASESKAKAVGTVTNAFEDPTKKVLTAAEEKKKAKKKEAKKKAKAKKRAAAAPNEVHAGAGKEAEDTESDSDDSSGSDAEEEGMDEEERMLARAPMFDLEKERAARKARAEAEAKDKKKTGE
jgi:hypothetical protein